MSRIGLFLGVVRNLRNGNDGNLRINICKLEIRFGTEVCLFQLVPYIIYYDPPSAFSIELGQKCPHGKPLCRWSRSLCNFILLDTDVSHSLFLLITSLPMFLSIHFPRTVELSKINAREL